MLQTIHYLYRAILAPLFLNPSMSPIHLSVWLSAFSFQVINGTCIGGWVAGYGTPSSGWFGFAPRFTLELGTSTTTTSCARSDVPLQGTRNEGRLPRTARTESQRLWTRSTWCPRMDSSELFSTLITFASGSSGWAFGSLAVSTVFLRRISFLPRFRL
jgi:hypothetical protein